MKDAYRISCLFILVILGASGPSLAQVATGTPPFGSFSGGPFDVVNSANLNVHIAIPIFARAGRGLPFNYALSYDSSVWFPTAVSGVQTWQPVSVRLQRQYGETHAVAI